MTPFRNDAANPWSRESIWPHLPQAPLAIRARPRVAAVAAPVAPQPAPPALDPEPAPLAPPPFVAPMRVAAVRRARPRRRELRLTPLIAAAAVGAGGLLALFLLIGVAPPRGEPAPPTTGTALAVGDLVGGKAAPALPPPAAAATAPAPVAAASPPAPRTPTVAARPARLADAAPAP